MLINFINYEREASAQLYCEMGKIPPNIINIDGTLYTELKKLSELLKKMDLN